MLRHLVFKTMKNRNVISKLTRQYGKPACDIPHHLLENQAKYSRLLANELNLDSRNTACIVSKHWKLLTVSEAHLVEVCRLCKKFDVDMTTLTHNPQLFYWSIPKLKDTLELIIELSMGIPRWHVALVSSDQNNLITLMALEVTLQLMHEKISQIKTKIVDWPTYIFKAVLNIPNDVIIAENFQNKTRTLTRCTAVKPLQPPSEDLSLKAYYLNCLEWYVQWRLQIPETDGVKIKRQAMAVRYRSIETTERLLQIYEKKIGFTVEEIKEKKLLNKGSPESIHRLTILMEKMGIDIKEQISKKPILRELDFANVRRIMQYLEIYGFNENVFTCPEMLLLPSLEVLQRLEILNTTMSLKVLKNSPRVFQIITKMPEAQARLEYLKYLDIDVTSTLLTCPTYQFIKAIKNRKVYGKRLDIGSVIESTLKIDIESALNQLKKHHFWIYGNLITMHVNLKYLTNRFQSESVVDNLPLILYPVEMIKNTLNQLDRSGGLSESQILSLCLYEIERDYHFSGNGIWQQEALKNEPIPKSYYSSLEIPGIGNATSEFSDSDDSEAEDELEHNKDTKGEPCKKRK